MSEVKTWEIICDASELEANLGVRALIQNQQVAVFRVQGKLYAIDNVDPFSNASVLSRGIVGDLNGQVVVASPIYKQHFNLENGQCLEDESVKLKVFPVKEEAGQIQVGVA